MEREEKINARINLIFPLETSIQITKESEKRGVHRAQFIKEAVHEKLKKMEGKNFENEIHFLKEELKEIKEILLSIIDNKMRKQDR